jgi:transposase
MKTLISREQDGLYHHDADRFPFVASLDCHDVATFAKIVNVQTNRTLFYANILGHMDNVKRMIERLGIPKNKVLILYEAGSLGFYPYRSFTKDKYACLVIAPSFIPDNNRNRKTNKKDCGANLNYHLSGILEYVSIPSPQDEDARDCLRYRTGIAQRITKQQQRITGFVKRHGYFYDITKSTWTKKHHTWLRTLPLARTLRSILDLMLEELDMLLHQCSRCEAVSEQLVAATPQYLTSVSALKLIPGLGPVNAMTIAFECRDLKRFSHPTAVPLFVGLVPGKHASGDKDPDLAITKEGNSFARRALVGASKVYRDRRAMYTEKELTAFPPPLRDFLRKLQDRLCTRYRYLVSKGKHSNKARCAIARELAMFLWEYQVKFLPYLDQEVVIKKAA